MSNDMYGVLWFNLLQRLDIKPSDPAANKWFNAMIDIYEGETHRVVHDLGYIRSLIFATDEIMYAVGEGDDEALEIAIWFHRSVYYPDRDPFQNILGSAQLAGEFMQSLSIGDEAFRQKVTRLIAVPGKAAVAYHYPYQALRDAQHEWMAKDTEGYREHLVDLRQEFSVLDNQAFADMRMEELEVFIKRDFVFFSDPMEHYNTAAMRNARQEQQIWADYRKTMLASI